MRDKTNIYPKTEYNSYEIQYFCSRKLMYLCHFLEKIHL